MVFQYCCEKSSKLEQIEFVNYGSNPELLRNISKSIGPLSYRPTLRSLFIKNNAGVHESDADDVNDELLELFSCLKEKPNVENLSLLIPYLKLSIIGQFINGNLNLKKLSFDERLCTINEKESFKQKLLKILSCNHGIEELQFVKHGWLKPWSAMDEKWIDRTILRNEFPDLVSYLVPRGPSTCKRIKKKL